MAGSMQITLQILVPYLDFDKTMEDIMLQPTVQRLLCEAILPIVEHAYREEDGDGLPLKQSEELRQASQKLLFSCPLVNLPTFIKLGEALDQPQLLQTVLQCINMLHTDVGNEGKPVNERVVGRALLIIAYGIAALPADGLLAMEESLGI